MSDPDGSSNPQPDQAAVYQIYLQLQRIREERFPASQDGLAGRLVACVGFALVGAEMALATTISGGTFLGIDLSPEHLKTAVRNGSCDFLVNTLDESLRVLKNELRKRKPLAVGLLGDASAILPAMIERGVQPDLVADTRTPESDAGVGQHSALQQLIQRGAGEVDTRATKLPQATGLVEVVWSAASLADLKRMDMLAQEQLPPDDMVRERWLRQAPGYFHRQRPLRRVLGLRPEELTLLLSGLQNAVADGKIQGPASVAWQTADGSRHSIDLPRS